ncbi:type II toxin-antitoxin system RelB/DinJ family antitoxin [Photobacterium phosphoreum]|uniref:type II toxin-antitoxin system RelB/DinJ family antitoxin n=1 Tax=Photobacterium phosphoreum TaxID=659 RepID=UPI0007F8C132|nr:type II toxin-antitoxin system RelB/DinJ family antitoxin [Photobacterium phosphoreum]OBU31049.1 relb antitoxin [Photobacterium phosphoreum]PSW32571.1 type II toxin-antitoxin system RelB/DinJ family antitoxin [Photobacterium phosphoreum]
MKTEMVRARVSSELKHESEVILSELGMSMSDAIRIFLSQIKLRNEFPIELKIPNRETLKAMKEPVTKDEYSSASDLFSDVLGCSDVKN